MHHAVLYRQFGGSRYGVYRAKSLLGNVFYTNVTDPTISILTLSTGVLRVSFLGRTTT